MLSPGQRAELERVILGRTAPDAAARVAELVDGWLNPVPDVVLDVAVPRPLNANQTRGMNRYAYADAAAEIRTLGWAAWGRAGQPRLERAHCTVTFRFPDDRTRRDVHNWTPTWKHALDGAVKGPPGLPKPMRKVFRGLLPDDSDEFLIGPDPRTDPVPDPSLRPGGVRMTLAFTALP